MVQINSEIEKTAECCKKSLMAPNIKHIHFHVSFTKIANSINTIFSLVSISDLDEEVWAPNSKDVQKVPQSQNIVYQ